MLVNTFYESKVDQLTDVAHRLHRALTAAGISYQVVGGLAVFCHVDQIDPLAARLTRDIDIAIRREDLARIAAAVAPAGLRWRHVAGIDTLVDAEEPKARSAVHMVFAGEKVQAGYPAAVPEIGAPVVAPQGFLIAPVADILRTKLTRFGLKDQVHIQDMDSVGLITADLEEQLPELLRARLAQVRATG